MRTHAWAPSRTARNGFRMEKEISLSNLQHRFSCQEILESKKKKKIIITKKRTLQFARKGLGHVKSDPEMEPESRDNGEEERRGEGLECLSQQQPGLRGTLLAQEGWKQNLCLKDQLTPGHPFSTTLSPSMCTLSPGHEPRFQHMAPGLNLSSFTDSCDGTHGAPASSSVRRTPTPPSSSCWQHSQATRLAA